MILTIIDFYLEPDVGMPQAEAQRYFRQLISGVVSYYFSIYLPVLYIPFFR